MKLSDILKEDKIITDFKGETKEEIINELIDLFKDDDRVKDLNKLRETVLERENIMSTGVGKGLAIPHGKTDAVKKMIAGIGILSNPIDFESLDKKPVNIIVLLVGEENAIAPHIKMLSRISRMMNKDEFREKLVKSASPKEIYKLLLEEEKNYLELS